MFDFYKDLDKKFQDLAHQVKQVNDFWIDEDFLMGNFQVISSFIQKFYKTKNYLIHLFQTFF